MIDWSQVNVKWEEGTNGVHVPYVLERGPKGRFVKRYLTDAEQNEYKRSHHSASVSASSDPVNLSAGEAGPVGPGPCPQGPANAYDPAPEPLYESDVDLGAATRLARRSTTLLLSVQRLSAALYDFGLIYDNSFAEIINRAKSLNQNQEADSSSPTQADYNDTDSNFLRLAGLLNHSWYMDRGASPARVIGNYAAPTLVTLQYLLGLALPDSDCCIRASHDELMFRTDAQQVPALANDLLNEYNHIQSCITALCQNLAGHDIPQSGGDMQYPQNASIIEYVSGVDDLISYLVERVDALSEIIEGTM
ncbi:hypothetical protein pEaSNUABM13_00079 [Erwinia phage pEa_SNUABM_13]|uniref:Uncharacterized protein n=1 Tax=Erwinia phage pEa_SNUABM_7 TaxID=2866695 RepID=A0AAE7WS68_9CAUD|nr:hypothetical protein MPK74_gp079 [Erwinia phage pEa_SNUABM_7]QYW03038.1 hypothetical protein pEaSNUABM13_00079 [Erwinia phage pEa_SNUABM_13]QYW03379.1 hypothetical protein pEaSNUABM34_00077 [Erwinia phage pEa_SNUABM_34]QYW05092.1 hypothetical protein pEaSNUABM21_00078 [Erwinia phage pEa_SNUABM_21]QYW05434.1 hypothetical protein pEaSNUABM25_00078 [Erwinia phage pEa_SNUABM_25]QYW04747.1 hypothetical protein pEaSNUABM7_00079 [Erwinia phage pEa_SNUABM_7]